MKTLRLLAFAASAVFACQLSAFADTVSIAKDTSANPPNGNFGSPTSVGSVAYTITTSDDGTNFNVVLSTSDLSALPFANLYFDTIASTPNTGSNLGFEFGQSSQDAFDPSTSQKFDLTGTGVTSVFTIDGSGSSAVITIPNSFFLTNPLGMPFTPTPAGSLVSLHLSQSFGYEVVGGGANFPAPIELGAATVGSSEASPTPEPATIQYMLLSGLGVLGATGRRLIVRRRA